MAFSHSEAPAGGGAASGKCPAPGEDRGGRRIRRRQDHLRHLDLRDPAAADRGGDDQCRRWTSTTLARPPTRPPPPWPWTSAASPWVAISSSTCSAPPVRTASSSCGTTWSAGAIGAVVLVDTTRLADCFPAVDYFEQRQVPFVVAVNCFGGAARHRIEDVREALAHQPGRADHLHRRPRAGGDQGRPARAGPARPGPRPPADPSRRQGSRVRCRALGPTGVQRAGVERSSNRLNSPGRPRREAPSRSAP